MINLRQFLNEYAQSNGFGIEDEVIREILTEAESLKTHGHDKHRWYTKFLQVVKIGDIFIEFVNYENSGDEPALDDDEWTEMVLSTMKQVEPYEKTVIDYRPLTV